MANKPLPSPEELRQLLSYDPETGKLFWKSRNRENFATERGWKIWLSICQGREAFTSKNSNGYLIARVCGVSLRAHRVAWAINFGEWPPEDIDHINGNRIDNRIANLRAVTRAENCRNRALSYRNQSGIYGVSFDQKLNKWIVRIYIDGQQKNIGYFVHKEDAVKCRKSSERALGYHRNHGRIT